MPPTNKNYPAKLLTLNLSIQISYLKFSTTTIGTAIGTNRLLPEILTILSLWQSCEQGILRFYVFRVITLPTRCINNVITLTVIIVISGNTITTSNSM